MDLLAIGVVRSPHGVKGELRVQSYSGSVENWSGLREACFRKGKAGRIRVIVSLRPSSGWKAATRG
jgi:ribosomal 30S subunit maturation factor RimM